MNLRQLHEEFIDSARRPMQLGRLPIKANKQQLPVVPMNKWVQHDDPKSLVKEFQFRRPTDRSKFIKTLLDYEDEVGHAATILFVGDFVRISLVTQNIDQVTELDKEYAKFADVVFKDIVTRPDENNAQY